MLNKEIDEVEFQITKLDVFEANALDRQLQELLPVVMKGIEIAAGDGENSDVLDLDFAKLAEAIQNIFKQMSAEDFKTFCLNMFKCVTALNVGGEGGVGGASVSLDTEDGIKQVHLKVSSLYKLLFAVMEENGFIPFELLTFGPQIKKILSSLGVSKD